MGLRRVDEILEILFPSTCILCGLPAVPGGPACDGCLADLPWDAGEPGRHAPFDEARSALSYEYPVDRLIAAAKFGREAAIARGLGQLLELGMPALADPPDAVVPVPLHWRREADRGFNQSEEIARALCQVRDWPLRTGLCRRIRATPEQSALGAASRRDNLRGAFSLAAPREVGALGHVLVIDDVLTTGATAGALAEVFHAAGVPRLTLWTVARTPAPTGGPQATARKV